MRVCPFPSAAVVIVSAVVLASTARAAAPEPLLPPPETGLITFAAGVRLVPQEPLIESARAAGFALTSRLPATPVAIVPFSYRVDRAWTAVVEFGWGLDRYAFAPVFPEEDQLPFGELSVQTVSVLLGGQRSFDLGFERVEPYLGFGVGYYLSTVTIAGGLADLPAEFEAHASGGYLAAGLRVGLGGGWALVAEERYAFAIAGLGDFGAMTVGGNTLALGVSRVWR